jgi:hypothetical protein
MKQLFLIPKIGILMYSSNRETVERCTVVENPGEGTNFMANFR